VRATVDAGAEFGIKDVGPLIERPSDRSPDFRSIDSLIGPRAPAHVAIVSLNRWARRLSLALLMRLNRRSTALRTAGAGEALIDWLAPLFRLLRGLR
jgi:hypothetical protein